MGYVIAGQTISLDGYVADANGSAEPLYPDLADLQGSEYMNGLIEETGAVVMGRRSFEMPDDPDTIADEYEFQAPIFVVTHHPPPVRPKENERLTFTFVTDGVESAVAQATAAAGDKSVTVVGGVDVIRQLLHAGLVDELRVDVMPVLLGDGLRFLDDSSLAHVDLEKIGIVEVGARTSLRFRVNRA
jgi:dihydrofolate reductase